MLSKKLSLFLSVTLLTGACNLVPPDREVPEPVAIECFVSAFEGSDSVTVLLQQDGVHTGKDDPGLGVDSVLFDGKPMPNDSSALGGSYFELRVPLQGFAGKHKVQVFRQGRAREEAFEFQPFSLSAALPDNLPRQEFALQLSGLPSRAAMLVELTDTSFESDDLVAVDTAVNGTLNIEADKLRQMQPGPVVLQLTSQYRTEPRRFGNGTFHLRVEYGLRRETVLSE